MSYRSETSSVWGEPRDVPHSTFGASGWQMVTVRRAPVRLSGAEGEEGEEEGTEGGKEGTEDSGEGGSGGEGEVGSGEGEGRGGGGGKGETQPAAQPLTETYYHSPIKKYKLRTKSQVVRFIKALEEVYGNEDKAWRYVNNDFEVPWVPRMKDNVGNDGDDDDGNVDVVGRGSGRGGRGGSGGIGGVGKDGKDGKKRKAADTGGADSNNNNQKQSCEDKEQQQAPPTDNKRPKTKTTTTAAAAQAQQQQLLPASPPRRSSRIPTPINPSGMPKGADELRKRPEAVPNPELPFRKSSRSAAAAVASISNFAVGKEGGGKEGDNESGGGADGGKGDGESKEAGSGTGTSQPDTPSMKALVADGSDAAAAADVKTTSEKGGGGGGGDDSKPSAPPDNDSTFPVQLHQLLSDEDDSYADCMEWASADGAAFRLVDRDKFESRVLSEKMGGIDFSAFTRILTEQWGFKPFPGAESTWQHPSFLRDEPELVKQMLQAKAGARPSTEVPSNTLASASILTKNSVRASDDDIICKSNQKESSAADKNVGTGDSITTRAGAAVSSTLNPTVSTGATGIASNSTQQPKQPEPSKQQPEGATKQPEQPKPADQPKQESFPVLLHSIICSKDSATESISWTSDGDAFVIKDPESFKRQVLKNAFGGMKYNAFVRKLSHYGFTFVNDVGRSWKHGKFHRDQPLLAQSIPEHNSMPDTDAAKLLLLPVSLYHYSLGSSASGSVLWEPTSNRKRPAKASNDPTFPTQLHVLLSDKTNHDAIQWTVDGKAFSILNRSRWESVLESKMCGNKYSTFTRNLSKWGFKSYGNKKPTQSWQHKLFRRNMPLLAAKIERVQGTGGTSPVYKNRPTSPHKKSSSASAKAVRIAQMKQKGTLPMAKTGPKPNKGDPFPVQLMNICQSNMESIEWILDGQAFCIYDVELFTHILQEYLGGIKFSTFLRSLNRWGFKSIGGPSNPNTWFHEGFRRDKPDLAKHILYEGADLNISPTVKPPSKPVIAKHSSNIAFAAGLTAQRAAAKWGTWPTAANSASTTRIAATTTARRPERPQLKHSLLTSPAIAPPPPRQPSKRTLVPKPWWHGKCPPVDPNAFPEKVRALLSNSSYSHLMRWNSHGKTFTVQDRNGFERELCCRRGFWGGSSYEDFEKKLKFWGFDVVAEDEDFSIWHSKFFLREYPQLSGFMKNGSFGVVTANAKSNVKVNATPKQRKISRSKPPKKNLEPPPVYPLTLLQKLRAALSDESNKDVIYWNDEGTAFTIEEKDERFSRDILCCLFGAITKEHFTDELISYGFHVISQIPDKFSQWQCDLFQRDAPDVEFDMHIAYAEEEAEAITVHVEEEEKEDADQEEEGEEREVSSDYLDESVGEDEGEEKKDDSDASSKEAVTCKLGGTMPDALRSVRTARSSSKKTGQSSPPKSSVQIAKPSSKRRQTSSGKQGPNKKKQKPSDYDYGEYTNSASKSKPKPGVQMSSDARRNWAKTAKTIQKVNADAGGEHKKEATLAASMLRGVTMRPSGKWQAQLYFAGRSRYIGVFPNMEKAALAHEIFRNSIAKYKNVSELSMKECEDAVNAARREAFDGVGDKNSFHEYKMQHDK